MLQQSSTEQNGLILRGTPLPANCGFFGESDRTTDTGADKRRQYGLRSLPSLRGQESCAWLYASDNSILDKEASILRYSLRGQNVIPVKDQLY